MGAAEFALPAVVAVDEPVCATFRLAVNVSGWIQSAYLEFHLSNTGLLAKYFVSPRAFACRVRLVPFKVSVKAPDSAAMEMKSVVVGLDTRLVDPLAVGAPPV